MPKVPPNPPLQLDGHTFTHYTASSVGLGKVRVVITTESADAANWAMRLLGQRVNTLWANTALTAYFYSVTRNVDDQRHLTHIEIILEPAR